MAHYKDHFLSMVKFCKDFATSAGGTLSITPPVFVNFDAHASFTTIPTVDIIGPVGFSWHEDQMITVHTGIAISTYNDPDNLRHIALMDLLIEQLRPTMKVPIYTMVGGVPTATSWMVVKADVAVEPTARDVTRSVQVITVQMLSGASGSS